MNTGSFPELANAGSKRKKRKKEAKRLIDPDKFEKFREAFTGKKAKSPRKRKKTT